MCDKYKECILKSIFIYFLNNTDLERSISIGHLLFDEMKLNKYLDRLPKLIFQEKLVKIRKIIKI